ncbi:hypothetical protein JOF53_000748 [Crossiella equi]|uniref:Uncharacterized protein n=1 Tax=Crossiella equi TaxID=130796 RepID=A0ABS5A6E2_9PSEU|nr:hypothetical protein [Crossiella equi]
MTVAGHVVTSLATPPACMANHVAAFTDQG